MRTQREVKPITDAQEIGVNIDNITVWENARKRIQPRMVDIRETNYIADKPHTYAADIPVIYTVNLGDNGNGMMSVPVTDTLLEKWGIDLDTLHNTAISNIECVVATLAGVIEDLTGGIDAEIPDTPPIYVLSNKSRTQGASAVLDVAAMNRLFDKLGTLAILPSSVHEVLVMPYNPAGHDELVDMVQSVNATEVSEDDLLSDHIYTYDRENGFRTA